MAYVKAQPKPPSYGSWGNASGGHTAGEFIKTLTGIEMVHVPYRSTSALAIDVGGHMLLGVLDASTMAQAKAGRLRPLYECFAIEGTAGGADDDRTARRGHSRRLDRHLRTQEHAGRSSTSSTWRSARNLRNPRRARNS